MPRRIFPAGTVTNTTGAPLRLEFYPTSTSLRREWDMWTVDGSNNLVERITNGIVLTDAVGAYGAFAGPDDLDVLYALPNNTSSRTTLTATGYVSGSTVPTTYGQLWTSPAASTTLTGTLAAWVITAVDCTAGAGARTLPAASSVVAGVAVCAKKADTSSNNLVVSRAGSDLIYGTGSGATSKTLSLAGEAVEFVSNGVDKWTVRSSDTPSSVLSTTYVRMLPPSNGVDDSAAIQAFLVSGARLRGYPGANYLLGTTLVLPAGGNIDLDLTGCTLTDISTLQAPLIVNSAWNATARGFMAGAMTSGSATLTATAAGAASGFTSADVGKTIVVQNAGGSFTPLTTTISAVTNSTTVTLAATASASVTGAYAAVGTRDSNIRLRGVAVNRVYNGAQDNWKMHSVIILRADHVRIYDHSFTALTGTKYGIYLADVTDVVVRDYAVNAYSAGLQANGPLSNILIENVTGTSGDDTVAITPLDGTTQYQDTQGTWTNVTLRGIKSTATNGSASGIKFRSDGKAGTCTGFALDCQTNRINLDGGLNANGVMSVAFVGCSGTFSIGPSYSTTSGNPSTITSLSISNHRWSTSTDNIPLVNMANYVTINDLDLNNVEVISTTNSTYIVGADGFIDTLKMNNCSVRGAAQGGHVIIPHNGNTVTRMFLNNCVLNNSAVNGKMVSIPSGVAAVVTSIHLTNCVTEQAFSMVDCFVAASIYITNCDASGSTWGIRTGASAVTIYGSGLVPGSSGNSIGTNNVVHSRNSDYSIDIAKLALAAGDRAYNTAAGTNPGVGPVICDGTRWTTLSGAVLIGTATLVGGTVTVASGSVTANSIIRLSSKTAGGTPGALYVSARTANTSFVITSTSGTDTSVVQYEILAF